MVSYCPARKLYLIIQCIINLKISERKDLKYNSTKNMKIVTMVHMLNAFSHRNTV